MAIGDAAGIRTFHQLPDSKPTDAFIDVHLGGARRLVKKWVGAEAYTDAETGSPTDQDRADAISEAVHQAWFARACFNLGLFKREDGGFEVGGSGGREGSHSILGPTELMTVRKEYERLAYEAVADYIPKSSPNIAIIEGTE